MQEDRGISIELSPEVAEQLRGHRRPFESPAAEPKGLEVLNVVPVVSEQEDWECEILVSSRAKEIGDANDPTLEGEPHHTDDASAGHVSQGSEAAQDDDSAASTLSYSPPCTLPVVLVDVERLTGYTPSSQAETESLRHTVRTALWGEQELPDERNNDGKERDEETMVLARDFEERVTELFATGMARHSDTAAVQQQSSSQRYMAIDYPEYVRRLDTATTVQVLPTARVWKKLLQPHDIPVVSRLLVDLLSVCSRSLLWKYDMRQEIVHLAETEEKEATLRHHEAAVWHWKLGRRKEQLDKLYMVRDTLEERLRHAQDHQRQLEGDRDRAVRVEMQNRRLQQSSTGGLEAFDFESTIFAFPDAVDDTTRGMSMFLGLKEEDDDEDDEYQTSLFGDSCNGNERDSEDDVSEAGSLVEEDENVGAVDGASKGGDRDTCKANKERRQAAVRKRRQRLGEAAKEAEHKAKLESAKAEEELVRELCTTHQLRIAMAVSNSLDGKLQQVDELLESLQEEQWADEEAEEEAGANNRKSTTQPQSPVCEDGPQLSLLDQILAMILGACPPPEGVGLEDHVRHLEQEHRSILKDWKDHFGRLPPPLSSPPRRNSNGNNDWDVSTDSQVIIADAQKGSFTGETAPSEVLRASLGIVDSEVENWDDDDEEDAATNTKSRGTSPQKAVGLRPGGRL